MNVVTLRSLCLHQSQRAMFARAHTLKKTLQFWIFHFTFSKRCRLQAFWMHSRDIIYRQSSVQLWSNRLESIKCMLRPKEIQMTHKPKWNKANRREIVTAIAAMHTRQHQNRKICPFQWLTASSSGKLTFVNLDLVIFALFHVLLYRENYCRLNHPQWREKRYHLRWRETNSIENEEKEKKCMTNLRQHFEKVGPLQKILYDWVPIWFEVNRIDY